METVKQVIPLEDFRLELIFSTGETRFFDVKPYLQKGVFKVLNDPGLFKQVYVAFDTACWPGGLDIAPETLYDQSRSI